MLARSFLCLCKLTSQLHGNLFIIHLYETSINKEIDLMGSSQTTRNFCYSKDALHLIAHHSIARYKNLTDIDKIQ